MQTPATIARHPIHPMLITFPVGLWIFSLVCDIVFLAGSHAPVWETVAFYSMVGGILGALAAAVPGFIDLLSLKNPKNPSRHYPHGDQPDGCGPLCRQHLSTG